MITDFEPVQLIASNEPTLVKSIYRSADRLATMARFHRANRTGGRTAMGELISIVQDLAPSAIVDVGCGRGEPWILLQERGGLSSRPRLILTDQSPAILQDAMLRLRGLWNGPIETLHIDVNDELDRLPSAQVITACQVLHHVRDASEVLLALRERITAGGLLLATMCSSAHMSELFAVVAKVLDRPYAAVRGLGEFDTEHFETLVRSVDRNAEVRVCRGYLRVTDLRHLSDYVAAQAFIDQMSMRNNAEAVWELADAVRAVASKSLSKHGSWDLSLETSLAIISSISDNRYGGP